MPPFDLEALENATSGAKDGREQTGRYPHLPLTCRPKFDPTATVLRRPPHTSHELRHTTRQLGPPALLWSIDARRPVRRTRTPSEAVSEPLGPVHLRRQLLAHALAEPRRSVPFEPVGGHVEPNDEHPRLQHGATN